MRSAGLVLLLACLAGCGGDSDEEEILGVMEEGRDALLRGDARAACDLLTPHGRERALGFQVNYLDEGTPVPSGDPRAPQTCEEIVRAERRSARLASWIPDLRGARFKVAWISSDDRVARAVLKVPEPYGPEVSFGLRQIPDEGWRIDDSNAIPRGY